MALDPQSRRAEGVSPLSPQAGSRGIDGDAVNLPEATYENPGPTSNIRGIEANTNWGGSTTEPEIQTNTADGPPPADEPFNSPDSSGLNSVGPGDPRWEGVDSLAKNSRPLETPADAFSAMGETYPANGGLDGAS